MTKSAFVKALKSIAGDPYKFICMTRNDVIVGNLFINKKDDEIIKSFEIVSCNDYDYYKNNGENIKTIQLWITSESCVCFYEFDDFQICDID